MGPHACSGSPGFNGAASVTEAEDERPARRLRDRQASTGPPRSPRRRTAVASAVGDSLTLQRGRLGHRGGGSASSINEFLAAQLQRGRLGHRGGGQRPSWVRSASTCFNGAASVTEAEVTYPALAALELDQLQRGRLGHRGGGRRSGEQRPARCARFNGAASVTEAEGQTRRWRMPCATALQRGRLGHRGRGPCRVLHPPASSDSFNGAASVTEAEVRDRGEGLGALAASTGPPRSPRRRWVSMR